MSTILRRAAATVACAATVLTFNAATAATAATATKPSVPVQDATPAAAGDVSWWWVRHYTNVNACNWDGFWYVANGYADVSGCPQNADGSAELWLGRRQS